MNTESITAYEEHALQFLQIRDKSKVGIQVANRWAQSLSPGANVIEIGCGGGLPVSQTLVEAGLKLWAIDSSPTLVSTFKQRFPDVPAQCASVLESDYFQRKYDAAISIGLIFLLKEEDQVKMIARVAEALHRGASFLFTAPWQTGTWTDTGTGHSCLSPGREAYETALAESGFRVVDCHEDSGMNNYYEAEKISASAADAVT